MSPTSYQTAPPRVAVRQNSTSGSQTVRRGAGWSSPPTAMVSLTRWWTSSPIAALVVVLSPWSAAWSWWWSTSGWWSGRRSGGRGGRAGQLLDLLEFRLEIVDIGLVGAQVAGLEVGLGLLIGLLRLGQQSPDLGRQSSGPPATGGGRYRRLKDLGQCGAQRRLDGRRQVPVDGDDLLQLGYGIAG